MAAGKEFHWQMHIWCWLGEQLIDTDRFRVPQGVVGELFSPTNENEGLKITTNDWVTIQNPANMIVRPNIDSAETDK